MELSELQEELAKSLISITMEYGPFQQTSDADGCDYKDASQNKNNGGKCCAECVFFRGAGCAIVYGQVEPQGICRFYIISEDSLESQDSDEEDGQEDQEDGQNDGTKSVLENQEDPHEKEMMELLNTSINFVKSLPVNNIIQNSDYVYTGLGVAFGGKDLTGDTFTKDTQFGFERSVKGMPLFLDHTLDGEKDPIGSVLDAKTDDVGVWFQFQIDKRHKYAEKIKQLIDNGQLGLSTGALPHVVIRDRGNIKRWITGELSVTATPADPRTHIINNSAEKVEQEALLNALPQQQFIIIRKKRN
jgi:hypothetical protein